MNEVEQGSATSEPQEKIPGKGGIQINGGLSKANTGSSGVGVRSTGISTRQVWKEESRAEDMRTRSA